jgi:hypothetical protein
MIEIIPCKYKDSIVYEIRSTSLEYMVVDEEELQELKIILNKKF